MTENAKSDVAQICLNGHIIDSAVEQETGQRAEVCEECGAKTITVCPHCSKPIMGDIIVFARTWDEMVSLLKNIQPYQTPLLCQECGNLYPWTDKWINTVHQHLNDATTLTPGEKQYVTQTVDDIIQQNRKSIIFSNKLKTILPKLGEETSKELSSILADIASETAKKIYFLLDEI